MDGEEARKVYFPSSAEELQPGSDEWVRIRAEVWEAMEEHGFFEAVFPELFPGDLRATMFSAAKGLFDLPRETKLRIGHDQTGHGYVCHPDFPFYETVGVINVIDFASIQSFSNILWPSHGNASFSEATHATMQRVAKLDAIVRKMIMESLGVEKYYDEDMNATYYLYRMTKCDKPEANEKREALRHHTDANLMTIIFQNDVDGLQVRDRNGNWLRALTTPNSLIVLAGDSLTAWSNGRIPPASHRVIMEGEEARYSMALFTNHKPGCIIQAPPELIDEEHPLLFKPFDLAKYLPFRFTPEYHLADFPLRAFCGLY